MLFEKILPSLNLKTEHLFDTNEIKENEYPAFMVNKTYSFGPDTIFIACEINKYPHLDNKIQYDFYYYILDKKKRFNKWAKQERLNNIEIIQEYFQCSYKKACEYSELLNEDKIKRIKQKLYKGDITQ